MTKSVHDDVTVRECGTTSTKKRRGSEWSSDAKSSGRGDSLGTTDNEKDDKIVEDFDEEEIFRTTPGAKMNDSGFLWSFID